MGNPSFDQFLDIAARRIHQNRGRAAHLDLRRQQLADQRDRLRLRHGQHEHVAGLDVFDDGMHHQVIVLTAQDGARRAGGAAAGQELDQRHIHQSLSTGGFINGCHAQFTQPSQFVLSS